MNGDLQAAVLALDQHFLVNHPQEAASQAEEMDPKEVAAEIAQQPLHAIVPLFRRLAAPAAARVLLHMPDLLVCGVLAELQPTEAVQILFAFEAPARQHALEQLDPAIRSELRELMSYPQDSAGRLMGTRIEVFHESMSARRALESLRRDRSRVSRNLFIIDERNRLIARAAVEDIAIADPDERLGALTRPIGATVHALAPREEIVEIFEQQRLSDLPVIDIEGRLLGIINHAALVQAMHEDLSADIQMMSGVSPEERALSSPWFAVRKRLPWLQINLVTAFLAASVVGLFEATIATFTALAVLLPVVAGQAGNSGAQALAVTMRGLILREITPRQWLTVTAKEASVGLMNGVAVAATCGIGVYLWSGSVGLVLIIMMSMVLAMVAAGLAGAIVPVVLQRLGQDPAQASSIILTTVTDVAGFFSFLGIATLLSHTLIASG